MNRRTVLMGTGATALSLGLIAVVTGECFGVGVLEILDRRVPFVFRGDAQDAPRLGQANGRGEGKGVEALAQQCLVHRIFAKVAHVAPPAHQVVQPGTEIV